MAALSNVVKTAWENREGLAVFTTVGRNGNPNSVYVTCVRLYGQDCIAIADNFFDKTRINILSGSRGALLFITKDRNAFQVKGAIEYQEAGEVWDFLKNCLDPKYPVHAAVALHVDEAYSGAEKIL